MNNKFKFSNLKNAFIIAEISANHSGSIETAIETIKAAKRAGADAVKLQTYTPDTITLDSEKADFIIKNGSIWDGKKLHDLYKEAYTPWEWQKELFEVAKSNGLVCFSSAFDYSSVDFLESINNPIYKIASFEITDTPLIKYIASKKKPIIISTGIAEFNDIKLAVDVCKAEGNNEIALLKCTSSYPAPIEDSNLIMINQLALDFGLYTGLSDHTLGIVSPVLSIAFGAKIIEKHFILNKNIISPDSSFSLDENQFKDMVKSVRDAEKAIGNVTYELTLKQAKGKYFSRSLYISEDVKKGEIISSKNIKSVRPGFGLHPRHLESVIGEKFKNDFEKGTRFNFEKII